MADENKKPDRTELSEEQMNKVAGGTYDYSKDLPPGTNMNNTIISDVLAFLSDDTDYPDDSGIEDQDCDLEHHSSEYPHPPFPWEMP